MDIALLDTNVLVYAADRLSELHAQAAELVAGGLRRSGRYCLARQSLLDFTAVVTRPRLVREPWPLEKVLRITSELYRSRRLRKIYPRRGTVIRTMREGAVLGTR